MSQPITRFQDRYCLVKNLPFNACAGSMHNLPKQTARRCRVVFAHDTNRYGGVEIYLKRLFRIIKQYNIEPIVMVPQQSDFENSSPPRFIEDCIDQQIPIIHTPHSALKNQRRHINETWNTTKLLKQLQPHALHIHTARPEGARKITLAAAMARVPLILRTEHNPPTQFSAMRESNISLKFFDWLTHYILTVSNHNRDEQISVLNRPPKKCIALPHGVEPEHYSNNQDKSLSKQLIGLPANQTVVGAIGRLAPEKGHRYLVEAAHHVLSIHPNTHFILVGDGELRHDLETLVNKFDISKNFQIIGFKSNPIPYINAMDIGVMPSIQEGLGLSLLEFMASSKPTIISDCPPMLEAIQPGINGLVFEKQDSRALAGKIVSLIDNPSKAKLLGDRARCAILKNYNFYNHADCLAKLYRTKTIS